MNLIHSFSLLLVLLLLLLLLVVVVIVIVVFLVVVPVEVFPVVPFARIRREWLKTISVKF